MTRRWYEHRDELVKGVHHSPRLQNAWNKYGEESFVFVVEEQCLNDVTPQQLLDREQWYLDTLKPWDDEIGYNISKEASGGWRGVRSSKTRYVNQYSLDGKFIKKWDSAGQIQKELGYRVYDCLYHRNKSYMGYVWSFDGEEPLIYEKYHDDAHSTPVDQYTKQDEFIKKWPSAAQAAKALGKMNSGAGGRILLCAYGTKDNKGANVKSTFGYKWKLST